MSAQQPTSPGELAMPSPDLQSGVPEPGARLVVISSRSLVALALTTLAVLATVGFAYAAWNALVWILTALILAVGLNPAVAALERRGLSRNAASSVAALLATAGLVVAVLVVAPPLVRDGIALVRELPELIEDLVHGRGSLGFLEADYHLVERVRAAMNETSPGDVLGSGAPALELFRSALATLGALGATGFVTFFMLREGPAWLAGARARLPEEYRSSWDRVTSGISRSVGGYVTGNLLISLVAGVYATVVLELLGVPYAAALGLIVAVLDLVPAVGATLAAIAVGLVALASDGVLVAVIALAALYLYQQVENHVLNPLVYARTSQLSPLAVALALLVGAEVGGVLGMLAAIPLAGTARVLASELLLRPDERRLDSTSGAALPEEERPLSTEMEVSHGSTG
jgi:predicted PurR-regulated permease PerM